VASIGSPLGLAVVLSSTRLAFIGGSGSIGAVPATIFSPKRTFDLCPFSDGVIVIIQSKAQQPFEEEQLRAFDRAREQVKVETGGPTSPPGWARLQLVCGPEQDHHHVRRLLGRCRC